MDRKFSIGVDYGTLSGRAVLVALDNGEELASAVYDYPHAVMDEALPNGHKLPLDFALQHPQDYLDVLEHTIPEVLKMGGVKPSQIAGVGIDFTACTMLPVYKDGKPLCFDEKFSDRPHAYVKLWKHHAAQGQADRINALAREMGEAWIDRYGGKISSEWMFPKLLQILEEDEEVYNAADRMIEAADWTVWMLTGKESRNSCTAGYKAIWSKREGFPSKAYFKALDLRLENVIGTKIPTEVLPIGSLAGTISPYAAKLTGLLEGTPVATANVDAHVAVPAVGIVDEGKMLMIMGTSTCHILMGTEEKTVPGMCGVTEDGVLPGLFGYEAGQSCVGDHFDWFVKNCVPESYSIAAREAGKSVHTYLTEKAQALRPGESGLLALDWWNGNRSVLVDVDLTGVMLGMTLHTKPEDMYRALIEATAYGTRMIIDTFEEYGVPVKSLYAAGGIAEKNSFLMQIYADVTGREIRISGSSQAPALGSAIFGAYAGGYFKTLEDAIKVMGKIKDVVFVPNAENCALYNKLYAEYKIIHDEFGRGQNDILKRLKRIKRGVQDA
jgi:L-ribulokinase